MGIFSVIEQIFSARWRLATRLLVLGCATLGTASALGAEAGAEVTWLEYRRAPGCPTRDVLERELLSRSGSRRAEGSAPLFIDTAFEDGAYVGRIRFHSGEAVASRTVRNENCEQVLHALTLIAALMLDAERRDQTEAAGSPSLPAPQAPQSKPPLATASRAGSTPPPTKPPTGERSRGIRAFTFGPWLSLTLDGMAAPKVRLGARGGALLTLHHLLPGSQQMLRLSVAQVRSGTIEVSDARNANITWTSLRLDVCHGSGGQRLASFGLCALFDVGRWQGEGWVRGEKREASVYWPRVGGAAQWRQPIVEGLALHADVGVMVALSRPEFYFAATPSESGTSIHRPPRLGPVADVGLELHFW